MSHPPSPTQSDIVNDSVGPMMISDKEEFEMKDIEWENEEEAFKKKLMAWLKNNNLKLAANANVEIKNNDRNVNVVFNAVNLYQIGQTSYP